MMQYQPMHHQPRLMQQPPPAYVPPDASSGQAGHHVGINLIVNGQGRNALRKRKLQQSGVSGPPDTVQRL